MNGSIATTISGLEIESEYVGSAVEVAFSANVVLSDLKLKKFCTNAVHVHRGSSVRLTGSTINGQDSFPAQDSNDEAGGLVLTHESGTSAVSGLACNPLAFVVDKNGDTTLSNVLVEDSTITRVVTQKNGAAIVSRGAGASGCRLRITGSTISENKAASGPAVYLSDQGILEAEDSVFADNVGSGSVVQAGLPTVASTAISAQLGADCAADEWPQAAAGAFASANQAVLGLSPLGASSLLRITTPHVRLDDCEVSGNAVQAPTPPQSYASEAQGAALRVEQTCMQRADASARSLRVQGGSFVGNGGLRSGAAIYASLVPVVARNVQFSNNTIQQPDDPTSGGGGGGGGGGAPPGDSATTVVAGLDSLDGLGGAALFVSNEAPVGPNGGDSCDECAVVVSGCTFDGQSVLQADTAEETPAGTDVHLADMASDAAFTNCDFGRSTGSSRSSRYASIAVSGSTTGSLTLQGVTFSGEQAGPGLLVGGEHRGSILLSGVQGQHVDGGNTCPVVADVAAAVSSGSGGGGSLPGPSQVSGHSITIDDCSFTGVAAGSAIASSGDSEQYATPGNASLFHGISRAENETCALARGCALDLRPLATGAAVTITDTDIEGFRCVGVPAVHVLPTDGTVTI